VPDIALPDAKPDLKFSKSRIKSDLWNNFRTCLSVSLPFCFSGATPPRPDPGHNPSFVASVIKRFGYKPPPINRKFKRRFSRFVHVWLKKNLEPLTDADIPSFEEWLAATPYSSARKEELAKEWKDFQTDPRFAKFRKVKSFCKDETYPEWKCLRAINSRVDSAKCYFGPIVQAVSDKLFSLPWFIKKIPVPDRPVVIGDALSYVGPDEDYIFTDYTAFEAHFIKEVMEITQVKLFEHMLSKTNQSEWLRVYTSTMTGTNHCVFKNFDVFVDAVRMSGEMDTSLSNGFSNLMLFLFCCEENKATSVVGFVEGDDGLFRVAPASAAPTFQQFKDLGFTIKIGHTPHLNEASFCGQVYHLDDKIVVTDIKEVVARLGWTNKKYVKANDRTLMMLLRAKAYSLVYQYNGCPVLDVLGRRLLDLTQHVGIDERIYNNMDQWERARLRAAVAAGIPPLKTPGAGTRALVEKLYNIPVSEQLALEKQFSTIELGFHPCPFSSMPKEWREYYDRYSLDHLVSDPCWMLRSEQALLDKLAKYKNCRVFLNSL